MLERLRRGRPAILVLALACAWTGWVYASYFRGANTYEFGEYAEIGRNILHGRGFTTRVLYPAMLANLQALGLAGLDYTPVSHRFPLPAYLSAASQGLFGETDFGSVALTLALFSAWVALTFAAAARWLGRREAALGAAVFAALPAGVKYFALFNLPDVPFGALFFAFHWALAELRPDASPRRCAALGAGAGLLYLCRFNYWLWLPLHAGYLAWALERPRRAGGVAAFLGAFAAACAPLAWYKLSWFGSLGTPDVVWNLAHGTVSAAQPWLSYKVFTAGEVLRQGGPALALKALDHLHTLVLEAPMLWQMQALAPFLALGLLRWPGGPAGRFAALGFAALAVQALAFAPLRFDSWGLGVGYRYLFWACPLLVLVGVRGVLAAAEALPGRWRGPAVAAWLAVQAAFVAPFYAHDLTSIHLSHPSGQAPRRWPELNWLRERTPAGEGVVTNLPAQTGWYAELPAVALPNDPDDVPRILAARPTKFLMLSTLNIGTLGDYPAWLDMLRPDLAGLKGYCDAHGYRVAAVMPGAVIVDLKPDGGRP